MSESTKKALLGEGIALVAWVVVMLAVRSPFMGASVFYTSLVFGIVAFLASAASIVLGDREPGSPKGMEEVGALSPAVSVGYFVVALIANAVMILASYPFEANTVSVVANVVLLAAMVIIRIGTDSYRKTVKANLSKSASNDDMTGIRTRLSGLAAQADDPAVKAELQKLAEYVAYSPTAMQPQAQGLDADIWAALDEVQRVLDDGGAPEDVVSNVRKAERLVRQRNAVQGSHR